MKEKHKFDNNITCLVYHKDELGGCMFCDTCNKWLRQPDFNNECPKGEEIKEQNETTANAAPIVSNS